MQMHKCKYLQKHFLIGERHPILKHALENIFIKLEFISVSHKTQYRYSFNAEKDQGHDFVSKSVWIFHMLKDSNLTFIQYNHIDKDLSILF